MVILPTSSPSKSWQTCRRKRDEDSLRRTAVKVTIDSEQSRRFHCGRKSTHARMTEGTVRTENEKSDFYLLLLLLGRPFGRLSSPFATPRSQLRQVSPLESMQPCKQHPLSQTLTGKWERNMNNSTEIGWPEPPFPLGGSTGPRIE